MHKAAPVKRSTAANRRLAARIALVLIQALVGGFPSEALAAGGDACPDSGDRAVQKSLLAVGDFGKPPGLVSLFDPRQAVAEALDEAHRCRPADGLLLLGDNFYPDGLSADNFERRVRDTVVAPFCRFLSLSGVHGEALASDCPLSSAVRVSVPILAVMGNHDYEPPVDGSLEKEELPGWIPEWRMPRGIAEVFELPGGVSLIAIDSVRLHEGAAFTELAAALARSSGPWRILLAHHPLTIEGASWERRYAKEILRVIEESGHVVHLMLAGHEHHLASSALPTRSLPLQIVAGSGARVRQAEHELLGETRRWMEPGFVRLDWVVGPDGVSELQAVLFATQSRPAAFWQQTRTVARFGLTLEGGVRALEP